MDSVVLLFDVVGTLAVGVGCAIVVLCVMSIANDVAKIRAKLEDRNPK